MGQEDKEVAELIRSIANKGQQTGSSFPVMSGTVVAGSVDMGACTCSVVLSVDPVDFDGRTGILINGVSGNVNGVLFFPADGSNVWVAEIDGPDKWGIIKTTEVVECRFTVGSSKLSVKDGLMQFNDGSLGGMVKVAALTAKLNNLENIVNDLVAKYNTHTHILTLTSGTGTAAPTVTEETGTLTPTEQSDIENTAVKQ